MRLTPSAFDLALFTILRGKPAKLPLAEVRDTWHATGLRGEDLTQTLWRMRDRRYTEIYTQNDREWLRVTSAGRRAMGRRPSSPAGWLRFWRDSWQLWQLRNRSWDTRTDPMHAGPDRRLRPPERLPN